MRRPAPPVLPTGGAFSLGGNEREAMRIFDQLERHGRRWTLDADGHHVQFGDLLDEVTDIARNDYDLFTMEEISEGLMAQLDPVLTKNDGESDKKTVDVADVRAAIAAAGL
jgi:hypothetical protein